MSRRQPNYRSPYATSFTRTGKLDTSNRKPFRTKRQKEDARSSATKVDGTYVSTAPVSHHRQGRQVAA